jgi:hypothetical protein
MLPETLTITGKLEGKEFVKECPVRNLIFGAGYLPRQWAKLELDRLLAEGAESNKAAIIALSKKSYVITPYTSLLVLETEEDYAKYNVDRGRKDHWAMYECPQRIPVVYDPNNGPPQAVPEKTDWEKVLATILVRTAPQLITIANRPTAGWPTAETADGCPLYSALPTNNPVVRYFGATNPDSGFIIKSSSMLLANSGTSSSRQVSPLLEIGGKRFTGLGNLALPGIRIEGPPQLRTYNIPAGNAKEAADVLREVYQASPTLRITPIGNTQIMVYAPPADQMDIAERLGSGMPGGSTAVFHLEDSDAKAVADILNDYRGGFSTTGAAFVRADTTLNNIIVMGSADQIVEIKEAIKALSGEPGGSRIISGGIGRQEFANRFWANPTLLENARIRAGEAAPGLKTFDFQFANAPWATVLEWLRDTSGLPIVTTSYPTGTVTFVPPKVNGNNKKYTVEEIIDVLNEQLLRHKYLMVRRMAAITIWPADDPLPVEMVKSVTLEELEHGDLAKSEFVRFQLPLQGIRAEVLAYPTKKLLGPFGMVIPLEEPNQLIMLDSVGNLRAAITALRGIGNLDVQQGSTLRVAQPRAALIVLDNLQSRLKTNRSPGPQYERLAFVDNPRIFDDLLWYAPGMNTTSADIDAVLEAEAPLVSATKPGIIEAEARVLIDRTRALGWQQLAVPADGREPGFAIYFNGAGQFAWNRVLACDLREQVISDGKTLWHLYPEIGLGAKRAVSRFHRTELQALVPWLVPTAEELAARADVRLVEKGVVGLVPRGANKVRDEHGKPLPFVQTNLVLAADGRLIERQLVVMPAKVVIDRQRYGAEGTIIHEDPTAQRVLEQIKLEVVPAQPANLKPDLKDLVVVSMPLRTRPYLEAKVKGDMRQYDEDTAIGLLAAACAMPDANYASDLYTRRFRDKGDHRTGLDVLALSAGVLFKMPEGPPQSPLGAYLAVRLLRGSLASIGGPPDGFIQRLATFRDLWTNWKSEKTGPEYGGVRKNEMQRTLEFLGKSPLPVYDWALLTAMCQPGVGNDAKLQAALVSGTKLFGDSPDLSYAARYEVALSLFNSAEQSTKRDGRKLFRDLYLEALQAGFVPLLDRTMRDALMTSDDNELGYADLLRQAVRELAKRGQRLELLDLPWQAMQLGDQEIANELMAQVLIVCEQGPERHPAQLAALQFFQQTNQTAQADAVLRLLLAEEPYKNSPALWRLAATLAAQRKQPARALFCQEQALALEFRNLPATVDLQVIRSEYGTLLTQYQEMANAFGLLEKQATPEFLAKVGKTADQWRALDPDPTQVCQLAGRILQTVGADDLAWDYLTTPLAMKPNEAAPWLGLAQALQGDGCLALADKAFAQAFEAEPTNAQILWDRAANLIQAGRGREARVVYQMLADGQWQPRFQGLKEETKRRLERN